MPVSKGSNDNRWILLLRGINVGGKRSMPMADLRQCLTGAGFDNVATYIQSGNVVLDATSATTAERVVEISAAAIGEAFGFSPPLQALSAEGLAEAIAENPFARESVADPKSVHYFFVPTPRAPAELGAIAERATAGEKAIVGESAVYLSTPNGFGTSKYAMALAKTLGPNATARNHRSVLAIAELTRT